MIARVKVHFQPVMEKFSPHDAIFAISEASELKETSLSAACSLHAASGSTSSTTSSARRRRLGEIVEDVEEARRSSDDSHKPLPPLPYEQAKMSEPSVSGTSRPDVNLKPIPGEAEESVQTKSSPSKNQSHEPLLPLLLTQHLSTASSHTADPSPKSSQNLGAKFSFSMQASRDTYNASVFAPRPKIKPGPRPSLQAGRRPHTSSSIPHQDEQRPVSTLPAGIRMAPRRNQTIELSSKPQAQPQTSRFPISIPVKPTQVSDQPGSTSPAPRPLTSPDPASPESTTSSSSTLKSATRTPEKEKLMRALELRRKQMNIQTQEPASSSPATKEETTDSLVNVKDICQIPQGQPEYPRHSLQTDDTVESLDGDNATQTILSPSTELGMTFSTPKSSQILNPLTAGEDNTLPSMKGADHGTSSSSRLSPVEKIGLREVTGDKEAYGGDENEDITNIAPKVEVVATSPKGDVRDGLRATIEDEGNRDPPYSIMEYSPVSSKNSTDLPSTQASSFSDEIYHRPPSPTKERRSDLEHANALIKLTPENRRNILSSTDSTIQGVKPSINSPVDHIPPRNGANVVTEVSDPPVACPMATSQTYETMSGDSNHTEADSVQNLDNLQSSTDILSVQDTNNKVSSNAQPLLENVNQGSNVSVETGSYGAESLSSARIEVIHIHSEEQRRPIVDPIRTDISADNSDDNLLSDDSLMDELHSATVQEAKPVSFGRSPITSTFPKSCNGANQRRPFLGYRTVSSPASDSESTVRSRASALPTSATSMTRSNSGSFLGEDREKKASISIIKKVNVSSGISQRIKALERVSTQSSRVNIPPPPAPTTKAASPSFPALRKTSLRSNPKPTGISTDDNALSDAGNSTSGGSSEPTQDIKSIPSEIVSIQPGKLVQQPRLAGDPTKEPLTRDIRTAHTQSGQLDSPSSDLQPRNLTDSTVATVPSPIAIPKNNSVGAEELPLPLSPPYSSQTSNFSSPLQSRRQSLASARSSSSHDRIQAKSPRLSSDSSAGGMGTEEGGRESKRNSKRGSRKSRLFRRISSISNTSRRSLVNALSAAVKEEEPAVVSNSTEESKRNSIEVGDINVQFPDSLVRR